MTAYAEFLASKAQHGTGEGFEPTWMPDFLFGFQRHLVEWAIRQGRAGLFADCGMGKTPCQLVWAENVRRHTGKPVLILTPLAVASQTEREAVKFGIDAAVSRSGRPVAGITVANYERLHLFNRDDYGGVVCDESSALKSFDGATRAAVTEFLRTLPYRLLCTATAAPNDYIELGTSSEALGFLGQMDMLSRFFVNNRNTSDMRTRWRGQSGLIEHQSAWRFKGYAEDPFWRWVASWARAIRRPSDYGFADDGFVLPALEHRQHVVRAERLADGMLFDLPAIGLDEQRDEQRRTLNERCELAAELLKDADRAVAWCHLNAEGDLLTRLIPGAVQVSGSDTLAAKEEALRAFTEGAVRVLVLKPKLGAWGLNWQHCHRMTYFPSHSYEAYYQAVRRCWRFGQEHPVTVDIVTTEGGSHILKSLTRKSAQADRMFDALVAHMRDALVIQRTQEFNARVEVASWVAS